MQRKFAHLNPHHIFNLIKSIYPTHWKKMHVYLYVSNEAIVRVFVCVRANVTQIFNYAHI